MLDALLEGFDPAQHPRGALGRWVKGGGKGRGGNFYLFHEPGKDPTRDESFGATFDSGVDQGGKFGGSTREWVVTRWPPGTEPELQSGENVGFTPTLKAAKADVEARRRRAKAEAARWAAYSDEELRRFVANGGRAAAAELARRGKR